MNMLTDTMKGLFNKEWTLFLDRDGVLNERIVNGYVTQISELKLIDNVPDALAICDRFFGRIIVVSNQQCIGKGLCTDETVGDVNVYLADICKVIDAIYWCPHLASERCHCRKPETGLAIKAKKDYPEIDFSKSVMVGDQLSDLLFGKNCGMKTVLVGEHILTPSEEIMQYADYCFNSLIDFAKSLE